MRAIAVVRRPRCFDVIQLHAALMCYRGTWADVFGLVAQYTIECEVYLYP